MRLAIRFCFVTGGIEIDEAPLGSRKPRGPGWSALSSLSFAVKLAVAGIGERSKDGASALIDRLTNVHGEGENKDEKEEIDTKQRMQ